MTALTMNTGASAPAAVTPPAGHDAAMAAKFDAAQTQAANPSTAQAAPAPTEQPQADRPSWLPEQFKTPEDMAKAYAELRTKMDQGGARQPEAAQPQTQQAPAQADAQAALEGAGLDYDAFAREFQTSGELSTASYEKLAKAGIPQHMVDSYIEGQRSIADATRNDVLASVGGEEAFTQIVQWAAVNVPKDELQAYNAVVDTGDKAQIKLAVAGMKARYEAANGSEPKLLNGSTQGSGGSVNAFRSNAELVEAMRDPRYAKDPAYRADVENRLRHSSIF